MADQSQPPVNQRFKADMPQIPGVVDAAMRPAPAGSGGPWLVLGGILAVLLAIAVGGKFLFKPHHSDSPSPNSPQAQVSAPVPEIPVPVAITSDSPIATVSDLAKPWDARQFTFHNRTTGENVPAIVVRLPQSSAAQASGYWSFAMRAAYGNCRLEYVDDLDKLKTDYGYAQARHPLVGNPCNRTLYDPLKYATLPGDLLARGAIIQGTDLRPPLSIEIKIHGKDLLATRME